MSYILQNQMTTNARYLFLNLFFLQIQTFNILNKL